MLDRCWQPGAAGDVCASLQRALDVHRLTASDGVSQLIKGVGGSSKTLRHSGKRTIRGIQCRGPPRLSWRPLKSIPHFASSLRINNQRVGHRSSSFVSILEPILYACQQEAKYRPKPPYRIEPILLACSASRTPPCHRVSHAQKHTRRRGQSLLFANSFTSLKDQTKHCKASTLTPLATLLAREHALLYDILDAIRYESHCITVQADRDAAPDRAGPKLSSLVVSTGVLGA